MAEITQDQLKLLMEAYKDSVTLNTKLLTKMDSVVEAQRSSCQSIEKLCDKINQQTITMTAANVQISDKLFEVRTESLKEHNSIKHKIYVALSLMGTIVVALITALVKILSP